MGLALPKAQARPAPHAQYGALPWRIADGTLQILLITTRRTGRWIIPKGWPIDDHAPHHSAAREALEEAGLIGAVDEAPLGAFRYRKERKSGAVLPCTVTVFALRVIRQRKTWPEKAAREVRWFSLEEALAAVAEPELRRLIMKFGRIAKP